MIMDNLIKILYVAFTTGSVFTCLLITILLLRNKKRELLIYEKHVPILYFEALLLVIAFFMAVWFGVRIIITGGI